MAAMACCRISDVAMTFDAVAAGDAVLSMVLKESHKVVCSPVFYYPFPFPILPLSLLKEPQKCRPISRDGK